MIELVLPAETLPIDGDAPYVTTAYIEGGVYGLIIAEDTQEDSAIGHNTIYPSGIETRVMQVPFPGGILPNHTVIEYVPPLSVAAKDGRADAKRSPYGPCVYNELANKKRSIDELN